MIAANDTIERILNRIYLDELANKPTIKTYFIIKDELQKLETSVLTRYAKYDNLAPLCWKKEDDVLVVDIKNIRLHIENILLAMKE